MRRMLLFLVLIFTTIVSYAQLAVQEIQVSQPIKGWYENIQIPISVNSQAWVENNLVNSEDDIWLTLECGTNQAIPFWVEKGWNTDSTVIWFRLEEIPEVNTLSVFLIFGNVPNGVQPNFTDVFLNPLILNTQAKADAFELGPNNPEFRRLSDLEELKLTRLDTTYHAHSWIWEAEYDWFELSEGVSWNFQSPISNLDTFQDPNLKELLFHRLLVEGPRKIKIAGQINLAHQGYSGGQGQLETSGDPINGIGLATPGGYGPGAGEPGDLSISLTSQQGTTSSGGGYGGSGGDGGGMGTNLSVGGRPYDTDLAVWPGSGGGAVNTTSGGNGGGAIEFISAYFELTNTGEVVVSGQKGEDLDEGALNPGQIGAAGGSGGGVLIQSYHIEQRGAIRANGGQGGENRVSGPGGSGGRIKFQYDSNMQNFGPSEVNGGIAPPNGPAFFFLEASKPGEDGVVSYSITNVFDEPQIGIGELTSVQSEIQIQNSDLCISDELIWFPFPKGVFDSIFLIQENSLNSYSKEIQEFGLNEIALKHYPLQNCGFLVDTAQFNVKEAPTFEISGPDTICSSGDPVQLVSELDGVQFTGVGVSQSGLFDPSLVNPGEVTIQAVLNESGENCPAVSSKSIFVQSPNSDFKFSKSSICLNEGNVSLEAEFPNFSPSPFIVNNVFQTNVAGVGEFEVVNTVIDQKGCASTTRKNLEIKALPTSYFLQEDYIVCPNSEIIISIDNGILIRSLEEFNFRSSKLSDKAIQVFTSTEEVNLNLEVFENGCFDTISTVIEIAPSPKLKTKNDTVKYCPQSQTILSVSGAKFYSWKPTDYLQSPNSATTISEPLSNIIYTVTGSNDFGCIAQKEIFLREVQFPEDFLSNKAISICQGDTVSVSIPALEIDSLQYSFSPLEIKELADSLRLEFLTESSSEITITARQGQCEKDINIDVEVGDVPEIQADAIQTTCVNNSMLMNASILSQVDSLYWKPIMGLSSASELTPIVNIETPGTRYYTLYSFNGNGCRDSFTVQVNVSPTPVSTIIGQVDQLCPGETTPLKSAQIDPLFNYNWISSPSGKLISKETAVLFTLDQVNEIDTALQLIVSSGSSCTGISRIPITRGEAPKNPFEEQYDICTNDTFSTQVFGMQVSWNHPGLISPEQNPSLKIASNFDVPVKYALFQSGKECVAEYEFDLVVRFLPEVFSLIPDEICPNDSQLVELVGLSPSTTFSSYINEELISEKKSFYLKNNDPDQVKELKIIAESRFGCEIDTTASILFSKSPLIELVFDSIDCAYNERIIRHNSSEIQFESYSSGWDMNADSFSNQLDPGVSFFDFTYYHPSSICRYDSVISLQSIKEPVIEGLEDQDICFNSDLSVVFNIDNEHGIDTMFSNVGELIPEYKVINLSPIDSGHVEITILDTFGCKGTGSFLLNLVPQPSLSVSGEQVVCEDEELDIELLVDPLNLVTWNSEFGSGNQLINYTAEAEHEISISVLTPEACEFDSIIDILLFDSIPYLPFNHQLSACLGTQELLEAELIGGLQSMQWLESGSNSLTVEYQINPKPYLYTYIDTNGCNYIGEIVTKAFKRTQSTWPSEIGLCLDSFIIIESIFEDELLADWSVKGFESRIESAGTYTIEYSDTFGCDYAQAVEVVDFDMPLWDPFYQEKVYKQTHWNLRFTSNSEVIIGNSIFNEFGEYTQYFDVPGFYNIETQLISKDNCIVNHKIEVEVVDFWIQSLPNAVSPNGDGINDWFNVPMQEGSEIVEFQVFDRWGNLVAERLGDTRVDFSQLAGNSAYVYVLKIRLSSGETRIYDSQVINIK